MRKHVVILFVDLVGSTALGESTDPEALRAGLARYFEAVSKVIWQHGGTVEKFIGDAVMAVFGVPTTREDDATRALRAAIDIHTVVARLREEIGTDFHVRVGVNSGEVFVTHQPDGQFSVTGDAVNTAQRLEAAAGTDETYVGDTVAELAGGTVRLTEVGPILHKGRSTPQQVFAIAADQSRGQRARQTTFVGREVELAELVSIADRAMERRQGWLLTYVGEAGIGKSRLISEFAVRRPGIHHIHGRCEPMNTGTYAPLTRLLLDLDPDWELYVDRLLGAEAAAVLQRLRSAAGRSDVQTSTGDVVWAMQRVVTALASTGAVAIGWDDLQWATEAQLDFITALAAACRSLPVLTICVGRPELFDTRPHWGGGRKSRVEDVERLSRQDLTALADERIRFNENKLHVSVEDLVDRAEGNPQVLQMLAHASASGSDLPASVAQLYEAALDRLTPVERLLVECAAVYGREFRIDAATATATGGLPDDLELVADRLRELNILEVAGDGEFRFVQSLFMQTAYRSMPKQVRSDRHAALAEWLVKHPEECGLDTPSVAASHLVRALSLLEEINGPAGRRAILREAAIDAGMAAVDHAALRGDPGRMSAALRLIDILPAGDRRSFDLGYNLLISTEPTADHALRQAGFARLDDVMAASAEWQLVREVPLLLKGVRAGEVALPQAQASAGRIRKRLLALPEPAQGSLAMVELLCAQVEADGGNLNRCHEICLVNIARCRANGRTVEERLWRHFNLQIAHATAPVDDVIRDARQLQQDFAGNRTMWRAATSVLAAALAAAGESDEAWRQWTAAEALLGEQSADALTAFYDRQYVARILLCEGRAAEAGRLWVEIATQLADRAMLQASFLHAAMRDFVYAGEILQLRYVAKQLEALALTPESHDVAQSGLAAKRAVESALAGDRATALVEMAKVFAIDRSEESPINAGFALAFEAILERVMGDCGASESLAEQARAAYHSRGASALADQVDTWVANADKLLR
ncbi:adenylate/guanylate cyclase domain-containing protein [Rudaeicoccus suwonensis]|uniref:Class 3 adenylate cyclase n=1 Tax=Rudaeicoccus suwonensis TaxID=657409 RepID=A0A561E8N7_9MICO|nr:adenylate/guanylate cyclase domain-containing protein [Rudaeicoccus suwonensis]TWE11967.1 class 3 adenylate cyclase [Rudaeicoccus suwonensis]